MTRKENPTAAGFISCCRQRTGENNPVVKARRAKS
jgi:hypothetical protein